MALVATLALAGCAGKDLTGRELADCRVHQFAQEYGKGKEYERSLVGTAAFAAKKLDSDVNKELDDSGVPRYEDEC